MHPSIERAIEGVILDNGMLNRVSDPLDVQVAEFIAVLTAKATSEAITHLETQLSGLDDDQMMTLTSGAEDEQDALPVDEAARATLDLIFEDVF